LKIAIFETFLRNASGQTNRQAYSSQKSIFSIKIKYVLNAWSGRAIYVDPVANDR